MVVMPPIVMPVLVPLFLTVDGDVDVQALYAAFCVRRGGDDGLSGEGGVDE